MSYYPGNVIGAIVGAVIGMSIYQWRKYKRERPKVKLTSLMSVGPVLYGLDQHGMLWCWANWDEGKGYLKWSWKPHVMPMGDEK